MKKHLIMLTSFLPISTLSADVSLNQLFSDGMVIQRETEAPVWGWADPGEQVSVSASWGQKVSTKAATDGSWSVKLKTPPAGGPHTIQINGNNKLQINDVLSGEVWLCTGQSNMDFPMDWIAKKARESRYQPIADAVKKEIETANDPLLRHIEVPNTASPFKVKTDFEGKWNSVSPDTTAVMTATGYFFAKELREKLGDVPIGLVECARGGTRIQPWIAKKTYLETPSMREKFEQKMASMKQRTSQWDAKKAKSDFQKASKIWQSGGEKGNRPRRVVDPALDKQCPATLHNGMLSAVQPFAIKGVIWYQGESNANYMTDSYEADFSTLISSWRSEWNQGDFPFYWAQLASFRDAKKEPTGNDNWASICDQQRRSLKLPNTGMAIINDIGEAKDIHPRNKMDVGKRLARLALVKNYGHKMSASSGPLYLSHEVTGNTVTIKFNEVGSGLMVGHKNLTEATVEVDEPLKRFQIAGEDRQWKWAEAKIVSKNTVEVSHPDISNPTIVKYAWSSNPEGANLYNKEGLPASLFTTE